MFSLRSQDIRQYLIITAAYLLLSIAFFWPIFLNVTSTVPGSGGDIFQSMWELWWVPYSMFTLHTSPYLTSYVYYPVGANLATQTLAPIAGFVSAIFQPVSMAFAFNIIFLMGFVLSGLFAYLLAYHVTKHKAASFLAGFIFTFSPIHTIQAFGHLQFTNIEFLPLFLLFFLKMTEENNLINPIFAGVSFVLLTFMGDIEQGLMAMLLAFFIMLYLLIAKSHRHKLLRVKFAGHMVVMIGAVLIVGAPFISSILGSLNASTLSTVNAQATVQYNELYSPDLLSFFIPSYFNGLLSPISNIFSGINAPAESERTTYIGYSVIFLVIVALVHDYKDKFKNTAIFLVPLVLFALLSIGPYLQVNGSVSGVPGLYQIYHAIPFFNALREPGRFDLLLELMAGIVAAIGFVKLEGSNANSSIKKYLPAIFLILLILEYNTWPISSQMTNNMYTNATIPKAYGEIGTLSGNFSVMMLPALPNFASASPNLYPGMALYYQTAFKKPLIGGYTTRSNVSELYTLISMPLADAAYYLQTGQGLTYSSPLPGNYTNSTIFLLGYYGVGFISINRQAYNLTELQLLTSYLYSFLGQPVYQSNDTIVFSTSNIAAKAGTIGVQYTPVLLGNPVSTWQSGWVLCGTSRTCNTTISNTWFAVNPADISLFSPNATALNVSLEAMSPTGPAREDVYLGFLNGTGVKASYVYRLISILNLTTAPQPFSFSAGLVPGVNHLILVSTLNNMTGYTNIGILNLTLKRSS